MNKPTPTGRTDREVEDLFFGTRRQAKLTRTCMDEETSLLELWQRLHDEWLNVPKSKHGTGSIATRKAYTKATNRWFQFLATNNVRPWQATTAQVRAWTEALTTAGLSPASVNQLLAACSSYYAFLLQGKHLVDGVERSAFPAAGGATQINPFKAATVQRPSVTPYSKAHLLSQEDISLLLAYLERRTHCVTGARNYALILSHLLTGARSSEICRLRWQDIRPNSSQPGSFIFNWRGRGSKEAKKAFPARAYQAIVAYLKLAGRYRPDANDSGMQPDDPIFPAMFEHRRRNLPNGAKVDISQPMGRRNVQRIFQTALQNAGVANAKHYRIQDLRHTLALRHYQQYGDAAAVKELLNHENLAATLIYLQRLEDPIETYSETLYQQAKAGQ